MYNNKLQIFCNTKDSIAQIFVEQKSNVIYSITCPGCFQKYVGKTDRNLINRLDGHGTKVDQPMYQYLNNCEHIMLFTPPDAATDITIVSKELHLHTAMINNVEILDKNDKWSQLQFLEAYYIKKLAPEINFGLKSSKELQNLSYLTAFIPILI